MTQPAQQYQRYPFWEKMLYGLYSRFEQENLSIVLESRPFQQKTMHHSKSVSWIVTAHSS